VKNTGTECFQIRGWRVPLWALALALGAVLLQASTNGADSVKVNGARDSDYPAYFTDYVDQVPDLMQSDERAKFPHRGVYLCGIVAASNSLMWLDSHGYPNLVDNTGDPFNDQVKLVRTLGLAGYTGMQAGAGITSRQLMRGVRKYVTERRYSIERLARRGWYTGRDADAPPMPELEWIKRGMLNKGAVWLAVGFYTYDQNTRKYRRDAGHWVTLVGYGRTAAGAADPNTLIIHDPSSASGKSLTNGYITARRMKTGFVFDHRSHGRPASACYELLGIKAPRPGRVAILEEAIVLQLSSPAAQ